MNKCNTIMIWLKTEKPGQKDRIYAILIITINQKEHIWSF